MECGPERIMVLNDISQVLNDVSKATGWYIHFMLIIQCTAFVTRGYWIPRALYNNLYHSNDKHIALMRLLNDGHFVQGEICYLAAGMDIIMKQVYFTRAITFLWPRSWLYVIWENEPPLGLSQFVQAFMILAYDKVYFRYQYNCWYRSRSHRLSVITSLKYWSMAFKHG